MSGPIDAPIRQQALDPAQSYIVQAPAGSGKTELLTRRVLTLLTTVDEPEQILAITFTKKAASEMRQRVMQTLQQAHAGIAPVDAHASEAIALANQVLQRDKQLDWQLMSNPLRLNLRTIDSLATQLAHRLPVTSALGAPIGMVENALRLYLEAAGRFIDNNIESLDLVLLQLGNKLDKAQSLLANLLANRDQWKRHVYAAEGSHDELRAILEGMLCELVESRLKTLKALLPEGLSDQLLPCLAKAFEFCLQDIDGDADELAWEIQAWADLQELPGTSIDDLNSWVSVAHALLTAQGKLRKTVTKKEGFPAKTDASKRGVEAHVLDEHKQQMLALLKQLIDSPEFIQMLKEVRGLPYPRYQDDQWALLSQLLNVLPDLLVELQWVFAEHALVDFSEISERAQRSLGTVDQPTDLALSMDLSLRHVLVDEFQDTSQTQYRLFAQLVHGWEPGDGRTFFAVGDPMQSIYRFREGDVALFMQAQQQGIGSVELTPLTLSVNFRTAPVISSWVNDTFTCIFPATADANIGAVPYSPSDAFLENSGSVDLHPLIDVKTTDEANLVSYLCEQAIASDPEHQVAILVRSRTQATDIFTALREKGLAYQSIEMDLIGERAVVLDLMALCLSLRYPHDRLHWLSLLRAPFVGLSLDDLYALMHEAHKSDTVLNLLKHPARQAMLSEDGHRRVSRFLNVVESAVNRSGRSALMPWVESVWLQLGGPVSCTDETALDAANRALTALYQLEDQGLLWQKSDIDAAMAKLYVAPGESADCQIQVMTLHKAKGLEFDTVIVPALDRKARADSVQLLNWFEGNLDGNPQLLLAPFEQTGLHPGQRDRLNKMVRLARERCDEQEQIRLLYVACTRAKRQLHLIARASLKADNTIKAPNSGSLLQPLWPVFETHFSEALASKSAESLSDESVTGDAVPAAAEAGLVEIDIGAPIGVQSDMFAETDSSSNDVLGLPLRRLPLDHEFPQLPIFAWRAELVRAEVVEDEPSGGLKFSWVGHIARDIGTVIHHQLQLLSAGRTLPNDQDLHQLKPIVCRQLRQLGVHDEALDDAAQTVVQALENTLSDDRGRWILQHHEQARSEWALSSASDPSQGADHSKSPDSAEGHNQANSPVRSVVIDRTFIDDDGVRWIIDYKTGAHEGADVDTFMDNEKQRYTDQLQRYADIIHRLDTRPIRLGLYFPRLKGWREWPAD